MQPDLSPRPQTILLVEDNPDDHEATVRALRRANMSNPVVWSQSGEEALEQLRGKDGGEPLKPGMVLLDLNMSGLDGRQTLQIIKDDPALKWIPVIILTTSGDERDVDSTYQAGANSYIQKPVSFDGLIDALKRLKGYWFELALLPRNGDGDAKTS
ncbi:MAG TPA: response regulator [Patescibacteria group bacterium]|nr:response regulator [Patescibacteria group bacterium]